MKQEDRLTNPFAPTRRCADGDGVIREYTNFQYIDCELYKEKAIKLQDQKWVEEIEKEFAVDCNTYLIYKDWQALKARMIK